MMMRLTLIVSLLLACASARAEEPCDFYVEEGTLTYVECVNDETALEYVRYWAWRDRTLTFEEAETELLMEYFL